MRLILRSKAQYLPVFFSTAWTCFTPLGRSLITAKTRTIPSNATARQPKPTRRAVDLRLFLSEQKEPSRKLNSLETDTRAVLLDIETFKKLIIETNLSKKPSLFDFGGTRSYSMVSRNSPITFSWE